MLTLLVFIPVLFSYLYYKIPSHTPSFSSTNINIILPPMECAACLLLLLSALVPGHGLAAGIITWSDLDPMRHVAEADADDGSRVIFVSKDGKGHSKTVQGAVDLVPNGNKERIKILISSGIYREKVFIPVTKPYVSFIGDDNNFTTVISWHLHASDQNSDGQTIGTLDSASVVVESDYFCARGITFENTSPAAQPGAEGMQAVALRLSGDKAMIYKCKILGYQDTLFDHTGRHYFFKSFIQGSIDFVFGNARSIYEACTLHAVAAGYGAVAASQRSLPSENSGFSFVRCKLEGSGMLYLGRAWGRFARVVYSYCKFEGIVVPQGWSDWDDPARKSTAWFAEFMCEGEGANASRRVAWSKSLSYAEARYFIDISYIDGDQWLKL